MLAFFGFALGAQATVGGVFYISDVRYELTSKNVYVFYNDQGGRGCRTQIIAMDIYSGEKEMILSCEGGELLSMAEYDKVYNKIINSTIQLQTVNLEENKINAKATITEIAKQDDEFWKPLANAKIEVSRDGKLISEEEINLCNANSQVAISIYGTPEKGRGVLVTAAPRDCAEGGYIRETYRLVESDEYFYGSQPTRSALICNSYKDEGCMSSAFPSVANVISDVSSKDDTTNIETGDKETTPTDKTLFYVSLGVLVVGLISIIGSVVIVRRRKVESVG